ncbi:hypothetical protein [Loigolactobacillus zhaoyuanensis]|uniref:hypothetical protein n=1 Tax=Loigolactobacillus zhaoyuanensis TaxID=2486017 RepID=UPI000F735F77|nr:hypothetical protein [Loigolactobacillus zhaoyuanensis]
MDLDERKYVLMTAKHSSIKYPLFWGHRTKDNEPRSFGGYYANPFEAELYSMNEITEEFGNSMTLLDSLPIEMGGANQIREFNEHDWLHHKNIEDVFVTPIASITQYVKTDFEF